MSSLVCVSSKETAALCPQGIMRMLTFAASPLLTRAATSPPSTIRVPQKPSSSSSSLGSFFFNKVSGAFTLPRPNPANRLTLPKKDSFGSQQVTSPVFFFKKNLLQKMINNQSWTVQQFYEVEQAADNAVTGTAADDLIDRSVFSSLNEFLSDGDSLYTILDEEDAAQNETTDEMRRRRRDCDPVLYLPCDHVEWEMAPSPNEDENKAKNDGQIGDVPYDSYVPDLTLALHSQPYASNPWCQTYLPAFTSPAPVSSPPTPGRLSDPAKKDRRDRRMGRVTPLDSQTPQGASPGVSSPDHVLLVENAHLMSRTEKNRMLSAMLSDSPFRRILRPLLQTVSPANLTTNKNIKSENIKNWTNLRDHPLVRTPIGLIGLQVLSHQLLVANHAAQTEGPFCVHCLGHCHSESFKSFMYLPESLVHASPFNTLEQTTTIYLTDAFKLLDPRLYPSLSSLPSPTRLQETARAPSYQILNHADANYLPFWSPASPASLPPCLASLPSPLLTVARALSWQIDRHFQTGLPLLLGVCIETLSIVPSMIHRCLFDDKYPFALERRTSVNRTLRRRIMTAITDNATASSSANASNNITCTVSRVKSIRALQEGDVDGLRSVLAQLSLQLSIKPPAFFRSKGKSFRVLYAGEGGIDVGGLYRDLFSHMCTSELQSGRFRFWIPTPNRRAMAGEDRDRYIPSPFAFARKRFTRGGDRKGEQSEETTTEGVANLMSPSIQPTPSLTQSPHEGAKSPGVSSAEDEGNAAADLVHLTFIGRLLGMSFIQDLSLPLDLPSIFWKRLLKQMPTMEDLRRCDLSTAEVIQRVMDCVDENELAKLNQFMIVASVDHRLKPHELVPSGHQIRVTMKNRKTFIDAALKFKLIEELEPVIHPIRTGLASVLGESALKFALPQELEVDVCGNKDYSIALLKKYSRANQYSNNQVLEWLWEVLEEFTAEQRTEFMRFVWGRSRLPSNYAAVAEADLENRMQIQASKIQGRSRTLVPRSVMEQYHQDCEASGLDVEEKDGSRFERWTSFDLQLPASATCFFTLYLPEYSRKGVLRRRLLYAITHGIAIDTDNQVGGNEWGEAE
eukprot:GDKJ01024427.1.p1 GENE.GDKJ01024427.1~~GDKJ01024427.1.p1  ORF type:complete len:1076 (+),score=296.14 GDKJ01024427.1:2264-5491(+)